MKKGDLIWIYRDSLGEIIECRDQFRIGYKQTIYCAMVFVSEGYTVSSWISRTDIIGLFWQRIK